LDEGFEGPNGRLLCPRNISEIAAERKGAKSALPRLWDPWLFTRQQILHDSND